MNEKKIGIILGYILVVVEGIAGLLFTVIVLDALGDLEYGLYKLAVSWMSLVSILDFGLGGTISRYVIKYKTEKDKKGEENFLAMAFIVYAILACAVLIIGIVMSIILPCVSKSISLEQTAYFRVIFLLLVAKTCILLFNHAYSGRFVAYERFIYIKSVAISNIVLRVALVWIILGAVKSVITVVAVDLFLTAGQLLCNVIASKKFAVNQAHLYAWDKKLFAEIFVFTSSIFLASIINQFNGNVDNIVLGIFETTISVGLYSSVMQVYTIYGALSTAVQEVFLPEVSKSVFQKKSNFEITKTIIKPSRMQIVILFLALTGFIHFGYDFLDVWIGNSYSVDMIEHAYVVGVLVLASSTWQLFQNSATNILKAKNLLRGKVIITAISTVVNFVVTILLVPHYGMLGAAIGTAISMFFGYGVATNIYYKVVAKLDLKLYYKEVLSKLWYSILITFLIGYAVKSVPIDGMLGFVVKIIIYIIIYISMIMIFGLTKAERKRLLNIISREK